MKEGSFYHPRWKLSVSYPTSWQSSHQHDGAAEFILIADREQRGGIEPHVTVRFHPLERNQHPEPETLLDKLVTDLRISVEAFQFLRKDRYVGPQGYYCFELDYAYTFRSGMYLRSKKILRAFSDDYILECSGVAAASHFTEVEAELQDIMFSCKKQEDGQTLSLSF